MISFFAAGTPQPQGSMRAFVRGGRPVITSANRGMTEWRRVVSDAARAAFAGPALNEALGVVVVFALPRPKSVTAKRRLHPEVRPDIDKLLRAVLDAGTGILWRDDSLICSCLVTKEYAADDHRIGVHVWVRPSALRTPTP